MGRKRTAEEVEAIINIFKASSVVLLYNYKTKKFAERKSKIWEVLSQNLKHVNINVSPLALFTVASKNYYNIWHILNISDEDKENVQNIHVIQDTSFSSTSPHVSSPSTDTEDQNLRFDITLTADEYSKFFEETVEYRREDASKKKSGHKAILREYNIWEKYTWPSLIRKKLFDQTKLRCSYSFKRAKIQPTGPIFAKISGKCSECSSTLVGKIFDKPANAMVVFSFIISGNYRSKHRKNIKQPLRGKERQKVIDEMIHENKSATAIRNEMAKEYMKEGEREPEFIPNLSALRRAKSVSLKSNRIDNDPIVSLYKARALQENINTFHNIGYFPFFVYFWTKSQIMVYRKYADERYNCISIDATGGVAKNITYPDKLKSKHILLYEVVINYNGQYSVGSMLSDSQSALSIQNWLNAWLRSAGSSPTEVVTDMSLALMYACVTVFSQHKSLADYLDNCYDLLFAKTQSPPTIFLRNDVAHTLKLISTWKCIKYQHKLTKNFYMRVVGQIIQCQDLGDMKNILEALFIVAYSDTEGVNVAGEPTICEIRKKWLIRRIGTGTSEPSMEKWDTSIESHSSTKIGKHKLSNIRNNFHIWVERIALDAERIANKAGEIGDRGNQQVLPQFVEKIVKLCNTLPLWTGLMCPYFPLSKRIASSASSESNFNNIKNRFFSNSKLPLRVDDFTLQYVKSLNGYMKLVLSNSEKEQLRSGDVGVNTEKVLQPLEENSQHPKDKIDIVEDGEKYVPETNNAKIDHIVMTGEQRTTFGKNSVGVNLPDTTCASCQLGLSSSSTQNVCYICGFVLHSNDNCVVNYEQMKLCKRCFKKGFENKTFLEQETKESWMRKNVPPKNRLRFSYLEPDNETLKLDFTKTHRSVAIGLIRNGNLVHQNPLKIGNDMVVLQNTCSVDSLAQLLCVAYCDSEAFSVYVEDNHNHICCLVKKIVKNGVAAAYKIRAQMLYENFPHSLLHDTIVLVHGESTIFNAVIKTFADLHMATEIRECASCKNYDINRIHFISVEINDISEINTNVSDFLLRQTVYKRCTKCPENKLDIKITLDNNFVLIEPVNILESKLELEVSLNTIPKYLNINNCTFILRGTIGYQGTVDPKQLGHFISYAYRHNDKWMMYNDLLKKAASIAPNTIVRCSLFFYTV